MDDASKPGQSRAQKTPEEIRAERIASVGDPKLRQELDAIVKTRDAQLAQIQARQNETFDKRVGELRDKMTNSANGPQLMPSGMQSQYRGKDGRELAERHAETQIRKHDREYQNNIAKEHNVQIDKQLDAPRENQRAELVPVQATRSPAPNRYAALISQQNYTERAQQAALDREKEQTQTLQQQRQRGLER